jgi:hypothetical protein
MCFSKTQNRSFATAKAGRYTTVSFLAELGAKQRAGKQSGYFEGDKKPTDEEKANGFISRVPPWPNGQVSVAIYNISSKYCSIILKISMRGVKGNIHAL